MAEYQCIVENYGRISMMDTNTIEMQDVLINSKPVKSYSLEPVKFII